MLAGRRECWLEKRRITYIFCFLQFHYFVSSNLSYFFQLPHFPGCWQKGANAGLEYVEEKRRRSANPNVAFKTGTC
jgi:hypothetical protein